MAADTVTPRFMVDYKTLRDRIRAACPPSS